MAAVPFIDNVAHADCNQCGASIDVSGAKPLTEITCPACGQPTVVPGMLDHYLLTKVLGQGSAGLVYQGTDGKHLRDVAIKVFLKQKGETSSQHIDKWLAEANAMRSFDHPNIVKIFHVAQKGERPYIVMELLPGERIDRILDDRLLVQEPVALKLGVDVAEGLKAVHDAGFAHLDVKPANMQLDGNGTCKLLDYDTSRSLRDIEAQGAGLVGTPYYVAPEIIERAKVDFRADMYSLGATMFHLLAQRPPFQGATSRDVVQERLKRRAITLKQVRPDISQDTSHVVARMLEPQPRDRYENYDALLADLRRVQNAAQWDARFKAGSTNPNEKKSMVPAAITGIVVVGVIGAGIWFGTQGNNPVPTMDPASQSDSSRDNDSRDRAVSRDSGTARDSVRTNNQNKDNTQATKDSTPVPAVKDNQTKDGGPKDFVIKPPVVKINPIDTPIAVKASEKWLAGKDVELSEEDGKLVAFCVGKSPFIRCPRVPGRSDKTNTNEPILLGMRLRSSSEGKGRVYWNPPDKPIWNELRSQSFEMKHDNAWHDYLVPIKSDAAKLELRIDLGEGAGIVEIEHIRYFANGADDLEPTKTWKFGTAEKSAD